MSVARLYRVHRVPDHRCFHDPVRGHGEDILESHPGNNIFPPCSYVINSCKPLQLILFRQFPYGLAAVLVRASVATFFLRAIPRYNNRLPRTVIITIFWAYAVFVTTNTFINAFQCGNPITSTNWTANPDICLPEGVVDGFAKTSKYLNVILDWTMSLIPSYIVFMSSLPRRSKISAIGVLSLAGIGSSISLLALVFYDQSFFDWPSDMPHAFKYSIYILWENGAAIVALSLAAMRPLIDGRWKDELQTDAPRSGVLPSFVNPGEKTEYKEEIVVKERELESEETTANTSVTARAPENEF